MELRFDGKRVAAGTGGRAIAGDRPLVVLLHGAGMDHTIWAFQARALAHRGRSVLALDFPGHGGSDGPALASVEAMAQWVLRVVALLGIDRFRLAGHSMGALVALEAAAAAESRVEALALVGVVSEMRVHPELLAEARGDLPKAVDLMVSWSFGQGGLLGGNPAPGLFLPGTERQLVRHSAPGVLATDFAACDAYRGAAAAAARIRCPTLFLLGARDRMTPPAQGAALAKQIPSAQVTVLPEVGHSLLIETPAAALAALASVV
jgi:pimeloyl-ACP methyl ester carboxylesterase